MIESDKKEISAEDCLNEVSKLINNGPLEGNGFDETAQRNGIILAYNAICKLLKGDNA